MTVLGIERNGAVATFSSRDVDLHLSHAHVRAWRRDHVYGDFDIDAAAEAAQRRSIAALGFIVFGPGITPDATPDQFWRQTAAYGYGGILAN